MIAWLLLFAGVAFAVTLPAQVFGWLCGAIIKRCIRNRDPPSTIPRQRGPPRT